MERGSRECDARGGGRLVVLAGLALAATVFAAPSAFAELGGAPTLAPSQRVAIGSRKTTNQATGTATAESAPSWSMREVTLPDGLIQREYLTADGAVFAVAWRGSHRPELSVLLGTHYARQMSSNARAQRQMGRGSHATTTQADETFAVHASSHQRSSTGVAWLPGLLPAGVDPDTLAIPQGS
ncbi:Protein of unknown function [Variovorax sp. YR750]|uniref:DUF2844 domain-containing protein n=1 Tax=Variovorax sp. YR750 TaxID=1884384 RepID=UPI0008B1775B|nr:DUF2844 domain-containing protein [Variovorax sp. YR750]SEK49342.1 Protein of unknown function [Variovorax sp. YR750]